MKPTAERIALLNQGLVEAKNLMEGLAIDFQLLLANTLPGTVLPPFPAKTGITQKMRLSAQHLHELHGNIIIEQLQTHASDTLRGLACYIIGLQEISLSEQLALLRPLADDPHFGVREWAWMAVRPAIVADPHSALELLQPWAEDSSVNIRRFASEATRPRGVWCSHIPLLRQEPWYAQQLVQTLRADPERYVQLSVGNWLNDAGKDQPAWVLQLCASWQENDNSLHTQKIIRRALRNIQQDF